MRDCRINFKEKNCCKSDKYLIFASMKRFGAVILLIVNAVVWLFTFVISLPFVLLYKLWNLCKRIFVRTK